MYINPQSVHNINAGLDRIQDLINEIEAKVNIEMISVWAKRDTKKWLQQVRNECYTIGAEIGDLD